MYTTVISKLASGVTWIVILKLCLHLSSKEYFKYVLIIAYLISELIELLSSNEGEKAEKLKMWTYVEELNDSSTLIIYETIVNAIYLHLLSEHSLR